MGKYYSKMSKVERAYHDSQIKLRRKIKLAWINVAILITQLLFIIAIAFAFAKGLYAG